MRESQFEQQILNYHKSIGNRYSKSFLVYIQRYLWNSDDFKNSQSKSVHCTFDEVMTFITHGCPSKENLKVWYFFLLFVFCLLSINQRSAALYTWSYLQSFKSENFVEAIDFKNYQGQVVFKWFFQVMILQTKYKHHLLLWCFEVMPLKIHLASLRWKNKSRKSNEL